MNTGTVIAIVCAVAMVGIAALVMVRAAIRGGVFEQWRPVNGFAAVWTGPATVGGEQVGSALAKAVRLLDLHAPWPKGTAEASTVGLYVEVKPTPHEWLSPYSGKTVAGETYGPNSIAVAMDLAALCHELAHATERRLTGTTDDAHATWQTNGIQRALDEFESA